MIRFAACAAMMLTIGLLRAEEPKSDWVTIAPEKEKYELQCPVKPKEKMSPGSSQYLIEREGGKAALLVLVTARPKEVDISNPYLVKTILDASRDSMLKALKGSELVSDKEIKFSKKYPARDIDLNVPVLGVYRTRVIVTPAALYQVTVLGPKEYVDGAEAKKFVDSFKLKD